jgi:N-acetyl-gamma-glutamyl-phosphate reductase
MAMVRVAIVGATGYTGVETLRLVLGHPHARVTLVTSRDPGPPIAKSYRHLAGLTDLALEPFDPDDVARRADVAFVGLPHQAATEAVVPLHERGLRVVDLSADFRLRSADTYRRTYGEHAAPRLLAEAAYGLPELFRDEIRSARLVATPGCYPTSVTLPLAPLLRDGLVSPRGIIADCKSGVTGAGRGLTLETHYSEVEGGIRAYKVAVHRHQPEMEEVLERATGQATRVLFAPHLVPMKRGILATIYADAAPGVDFAAARASLERAYGGEPFVKLLPEGIWPDSAHVAGSNYVHLGIALDPERGKVVLLCAIDNLVKGAAGAAVQCMNLLFGLDESSGLAAAPVFP